MRPRGSREGRMGSGGRVRDRQKKRRGLEGKKWCCKIGRRVSRKHGGDLSAGRGAAAKGAHARAHRPPPTAYRLPPLRPLPAGTGHVHLLLQIISPNTLLAPSLHPVTAASCMSSAAHFAPTEPSPAAPGHRLLSFSLLRAPRCVKLNLHPLALLSSSPTSPSLTSSSIARHQPSQLIFVLMEIY